MKVEFVLLACTLIACGGSASTENDPTGGSSGTSSGGSSGTGSGSTPPPSSIDPTLPADASPCVKATHALCEKACACTANGKCVVAYGGGIVTEEHDSVADCEKYYAVFVCGQPEQAKYYGEAACSTALGSAGCILTKSKGNALDFPGACKAPTK